MPSDAYESINILIQNDEAISDSRQLTQLRSILQMNPDVVHEKYEGGYYETLLHRAAETSSPSFCKLLIEGDNDLKSVKSRDIDGELPFHYACGNNNFETAKYLFHLWPACINIPDNKSLYPIHHLLDESGGVDVTKLCHFLLKHDQGAVSKPWAKGMLPLHVACYYRQLEAAKLIYNAYPRGINTPDENSLYPIHCLLIDGMGGQDFTELCIFLLQHDRGAVTKPDYDGRLPLHLACQMRNLEVVKLVYNAYPDGIHIEDSDYEQTPSELSLGEIRAFFQTQIVFIDEAEEERRPDNNGQLPLHRAVQNADVAEGTIKLMIAENPDAALQADHQGLTPLHLTCQIGNLGAIKHLVKKHHAGSCQVRDGRGELPLHHACRHGRCEVVTYILQQTAVGVKEPNADGKLPIWSLLLDAPCDRDSLEYIGAVDLLLRACPDELVGRVL